MSWKHWQRALALLLASCLGCTSAARIKHPAEGRLDGKYRVQLEDGAIYTAYGPLVADSTLVIHTMIVDGKRTDVAPFAIKLQDIRKLERLSSGGPLVFAGIVIGAIIFMFYAFAKGVGGLSGS